MSLVEIIRGWALYANGSHQTRVLMQDRLAKCDPCHNKQVISQVGQLMLFNSRGASYKCKLCKCFLDPKTADPGSKCPIGKW